MRTAATTNGGTALTGAVVDANDFDVDLSAVNTGNGFTITNNGNATGVALLGTTSGDSIVGGTGNDTITGGAGNDDLAGGNGNDTLTGGDGDDTLTGGDGDDTLSGGHGSDYIFGGTGNDAIDGSGGNDYIYGDLGNDSINGGAGDDTLTGGAGADILTGFNGADQFNYTSINTLAAQTGITIETADLITDFDANRDNIYTGTAGSALNYTEAVAVADFATALIQANAAFNADNTDLYHLTSITGGVGLLFVNTNGDAVAEAVIQLTGVTSANFAFGDIVA